MQYSNLGGEQLGSTRDLRSDRMRRSPAPYFRSKTTSPVHARCGPVVFLAMLLLTVVATQFLSSALNIEVVTLMRSGFSVLAAVMAIYVIALITVVVAIDRRNRSRSNFNQASVIE